MLTADLAMSWRRGNRIFPRYLQSDDPRHLQTAADLALIVEQYEGRRRAELEQALDEYIGVGTDYKILRGLIKLLTDRCEFSTAIALDPAEIRRALFNKASAHHPVITESSRGQIIAETAAELECSPEEAMAVGERMINMQRIIAIKRGFTPKDEFDVSNRLLEAPTAGAANRFTSAGFRPTTPSARFVHRGELKRPASWVRNAPQLWGSRVKRFGRMSTGA